MDNDERKEVFDQIVGMLNRNGLGWIVEHVNEQIRNGKPDVVEVETMKRSENSNVQRGPKARFPTTVDYDDKEKLGLLLDGIMQATNVLEMESNALQQIKAIAPGIASEISFYSEASNTTATVMSPTRVVARDRVVKDCL